MEGGYLCPSAIAASCERVSCRSLSLLPRLGFLDSSSESEDLKAGTVMDLPLWLAESLSSRRPPVVTVEVPKVYKESYREILKADASAVDLHKLGMYYYDFGCHLSPYDSKGEIGNSLMSTFRNRFRHIMDICQNSEVDPMITSKLDHLERELLGISQGAGEALTAWCSQSVSPLCPGPMVDTHYKRKLTEVDNL